MLHGHYGSREGLPGTLKSDGKRGNGKGRRGSLILVDIPPRDGVSIKILVGGNLKTRLINGINGTATTGEGPAPGTCPTDPQDVPDRHGFFIVRSLTTTLGCVAVSFHMDELSMEDQNTVREIMETMKTREFADYKDFKKTEEDRRGERTKGQNHGGREEFKRT